MSTKDAYHKVPDDHSGKEEGDASGIADQHAVPHGFDPFSAKDPKDNHERVHEINEMPPGDLLVGEPIHVICSIASS